MIKRKRTMTFISLLAGAAMLLSACGDAASTATPVPAATNTAAAAAPTNTTAAEAEPTNTTAAARATATEAMAGTTPTSGGGDVSDFDPSTVTKMEVEDGATLRISGWSSTPAELEIVRQQLDRFSQVYPDVTVNYEPQPDQYDAKLKAQISGGTEPDVFYVSPGLADELIGANKLLKLNDAMDEVGLSQDDYYENLISIFSREADVYGLPKDFGTLAVFYNTELSKEAPKEDWTWDDYKAWAAANTTGTDINTKVFGTMHPTDVARFWAFAYANGAEMVNADGTTTGVNSPEAVAALEWYYSLYKDGTAGRQQDVGASWPGEAFGKERAAAVIEGGWLIPYLADPANGFDVEYAASPLPFAPSGKQGNLLFTNAYSAAANSKFPMAAAALVAFLSGPQNQYEVLKTGFALPTIKNNVVNGEEVPFAEDPYFDTHPNDAVLMSALDYGQAAYYGPNTDKMFSIINQALEKVYLNGVAPKEALDQAASEINDLLQQ